MYHKNENTHQINEIQEAPAAFVLFILLQVHVSSFAYLLHVVSKEGEYGGAEHRADGRKGAGCCGGSRRRGSRQASCRGKGRTIGGEGNGRRCGDEDGAGNLLHLHDLRKSKEGDEEEQGLIGKAGIAYSCP
ncbi:hypothetical protein VPH35_128642 [Triticum aestivum]